MTTQIGDAKIKVILDTADAQRRLRDLEMKVTAVNLKNIKYGPGAKQQAGLRRQNAIDADKPSVRDDAKRALRQAVTSYHTVRGLGLKGAVATEATMEETAMFGGALSATAKGVLGALVGAKILQSGPIVAAIVEQIFDRKMGTEGIAGIARDTISNLAAKIDAIEARVTTALSAYSEGWDLYKATSRLGGEMPTMGAINVLRFMQDKNALQKQAEMKRDREIMKEVIHGVGDSYRNGMNQ